VISRAVAKHVEKYHDYKNQDNRPEERISVEVWPHLDSQSQRTLLTEGKRRSSRIKIVPLPFCLARVTFVFILAYFICLNSQITRDNMRQSTIFFVVAVLVLIWFGAEAFLGNNICVTSCVSLAGMNFAEVASAVAILPILIALGGYSLRKSEKQKEELAAKSNPRVSSQSKSSQTGNDSGSPSN
jgi:hypothetical protein